MDIYLKINVFCDILFMIDGGYMGDFIRVDVRDYVNKEIENGDLAPFWAIKNGSTKNTKVVK